MLEIETSGRGWDGMVLGERAVGVVGVTLKDVRPIRHANPPELKMPR